jgi:hypothetical protein
MSVGNSGLEEIVLLAVVDSSLQHQQKLPAFMIAC